MEFFPVSPVSPFLALPGEPPIPWPRWFESFETFIAAAGIVDASDARLKALLIHSLGNEGQRIFRTLGPADKYRDCVALLTGHFAAPQSVIVRRIIFRQRRQRPGESVHQYVTDLRCLASVCKFEHLEDEFIRDQLAEHAADHKLRERLLLSPDDTTLSKAVEMAFQLESAALLASRLTATGPPPSLSTPLAQTVTPADQAPGPAFPHTELEVNVAGRQGASARRPCGNCGSYSHATRAPVFPATGQRCQRCGRLNHFAKVCRSAPAPTRTQRHSSRPSSPTTIHSVGANNRPFTWCTVELDNVCLPLLLDTAASRSLLSESTVRRLFPRHTIKAGAEELYGYGHTKINMLGTATFSVRYGSRTLPAFTFQVSRHGANLLGFDLFCALGFAITDNLGAAILAMVHDGHLGVVRVKQRCRGLVWWPGIDRDIEDLVRNCTACLTSGKTGSPPPPPLQPVPWPRAPWTHIQVDICGELHGTPQHQRFLLVAYDLHSKWPEVLPAGSVTTTVVIGFLSSLFARWGVPDAITTDNGPQFVSADFVAFTEGRGIKHIKTAFYHPQANGGVERFNQTLKNGLRAHMADGLSFSTSLQSTLLHYRATPHTTTGNSPALLMLGRELQLPLDRLRPPVRVTSTATPSPGDRVDQQQRTMKRWFDRRHRVKPPTLTVSDWVRVRRPTRSHKLLSFWSAPTQITAQLGPSTFRVTDGSRWHVSRLRRVKQPSVADQQAAAHPRCTSGVWDLPDVLAETQAVPDVRAEPLRVGPRPVRARQRPLYLDDYFTDF
ncbi:uncharacterized protein LOC114461693 [Gouania willdenowi]|uniref:uncharacterized protein LOC114461693 n=1 Tax=Gouania willdenowi TaxID=441366 RepID=UPI001054D3D3|nr:uncharacterized protein LOC114461693 [Gouania willdenowi]